MEDLYGDLPPAVIKSDVKSNSRWEKCISKKFCSPKLPKDKVEQQVEPAKPLLEKPNNVVAKNSNVFRPTSLNCKRQKVGTGHMVKSVSAVPPKDEATLENNSVDGTIAMNVENEYNPMYPNDYNLYRKRMLEKEQELIVMEKLKERQVVLDRLRKKEILELENAVRKGNAVPVEKTTSTRGVSNLPAWMMEMDSATASATLDGAASPPSNAAHHVVNAPNNLDSAPNSALVTSNHVAKDLDVKTVLARNSINRDMQASMKESNSNKISISELKAKIQNIKKINTNRVVLLTNMVGPGMVDDELQDEIKQECARKYGPVEKCFIYETKGEHVAEDEAVRIFVSFHDASDAEKACCGLNGRFFDGRKVKALYFDQNRFDKLDLAP